MSLIPVPTVDLLSPTVVEDVRDACSRCGFFFLSSHGVPEPTIAAAWAQVRAFFDQPLPLKQEIAMSADYPYGYGGMSTEKTGHAQQGAYDTSDLKESFQVCLSTEAKPAAGLPPVRWPREPAALREAFTAYYRAMEALSARLLAVFERAAGLPGGFFAARTDSHWCALRALNYPEQDKPPNPGQLRIAPHSDYVRVWEGGAGAPTPSGPRLAPHAPPAHTHAHLAPPPPLRAGRAHHPARGRRAGRAGGAAQRRQLDARGDPRGLLRGEPGRPDAALVQ